MQEDAIYAFQDANAIPEHPAEKFMDKKMTQQEFCKRLMRDFTIKATA